MLRKDTMSDVPGQETDIRWLACRLTPEQEDILIALGAGEMGPWNTHDVEILSRQGLIAIGEDGDVKLTLNGWRRLAFFIHRPHEMVFWSRLGGQCRCLTTSTTCHLCHRATYTGLTGFVRNRWVIICDLCLGGHGPEVPTVLRFG